MSSISPSPPNRDSGANFLSERVTPEKRAPIVDRSKADPQIVKAAEGMEAMFLDYMMKVMRQSIPKNDMDLESPATEIYRRELDNEYAKIAARNGGVGLADTIIAYLESQRYTGNKGHYAPAGDQRSGVKPAQRNTGGTHEGQPIRDKLSSK